MAQRVIDLAESSKVVCQESRSFEPFHVQLHLPLFPMLAQLILTTTIAFQQENILQVFLFFFGVQNKVLET